MSKTNVSVFFDHYDRGAIDASEDPRWGDSDHRKWVPEDSPWFGSTSLEIPQLTVYMVSLIW